MFSIINTCCSNTSSSKASDSAKLAIRADAVLTIVFAILGILGTAGVLPFAAGITFCVLGICQGLTAQMVYNVCRDDHSSYSYR